jgi:hypothetical protein
MSAQDVRDAQRNLDAARRGYKTAKVAAVSATVWCLLVLAMWAGVINWGISSIGDWDAGGIMISMVIGLTILTVPSFLGAGLLLAATFVDVRERVDKAEWKYEDEVLRAGGLS